MNRLSIDLGKHLGWCCNITPGWQSGHIELRDPAKSEERMYSVFGKWLEDFLFMNYSVVNHGEHTERITQIVYELPFVRNRCNDGVILYGLLGVLKRVAYEKDIQLAPVHPVTLKCEITGSGRADKQDMIEIASHAMDKQITSSDEADAVCLMLYAEFGTLGR